MADSDPFSSFWKKLFVDRETKSRCFMDRYNVDSLHGNTEAVRAVFLLHSAGLVFTGGYDSVVQIWDMDDGFLISASRPLGCTIRAIVADAGLVMVAGTDVFLHYWRATPGHPRRFDITGFVVHLATIAHFILLIQRHASKNGTGLSYCEDSQRGVSLEGLEKSRHHLHLPSTTNLKKGPCYLCSLCSRWNKGGPP